MCRRRLPIPVAGNGGNGMQAGKANADLGFRDHVVFGSLLSWANTDELQEYLEVFKESVERGMWLL